MTPAQRQRSDTVLASVRPELSHIAKYVEEYADQSGIKIMWVQGLRTQEQQAKLYAQGRTAPGPQVTQAPTAETTPHGRGAALDFAILDLNGQPSWAPGLTSLYEQVGRLAEGLGLQWGGRFPHADRPHVELRGWHQLPFPYDPQKQT